MTEGVEFLESIIHMLDEPESLSGVGGIRHHFPGVWEGEKLFSSQSCVRLCLILRVSLQGQEPDQKWSQISSIPGQWMVFWTEFSMSTHMGINIKIMVGAYQYAANIDLGLH